MDLLIMVPMIHRSKVSNGIKVMLDIVDAVLLLNNEELSEIVKVINPKIIEISEISLLILILSIPLLLSRSISSLS